jgi:hypothetical protein
MLILDRWTAICRGAVIRGLLSENVPSTLAVNVQRRIARMSFGIRVQRAWERGRYFEADKVWSHRWCEWQATNQMNWFLKIVSHFFRQLARLTQPG